MANTSYYLYQKYEQRGDQAPIPVYPNYWSVDGDGTMPLVKKMDNDPSCGYVPPVTAIYRWVNIDITKDYVCNECPQYRTISTGYTCVGYDKHYLDEYQVSYDAGATWQTLSSSTGSLIETDSEYCGYVPPVIAQKFRATYNDSTTYSAACDSSTELTTATTKAHTTSYMAMTSAVIGDCVTSIGIQAFFTCVNLTGITIPSSVTSIGLAAFNTCVALTGITIPDSVISLGDEAFLYCSSLTDVTIPSGVTNIGRQAFDACTGLLSVTVNATTPPTLGYDAFCDSTCPIYVPAASVNAYKSATNWSDYASRIQAIQT